MMPLTRHGFPTSRQQIRATSPARILRHPSSVNGNRNATVARPVFPTEHESLLSDVSASFHNLRCHRLHESYGGPQT